MWQIWIDRGGTFTDCLGRDPANGHIRSIKLLSTDRAPLVGIRALMGLDDGAPIPACEVRMGTTIATNALLERRGARCALVITRGFRDLLAIGNQTRPDLFDLDIRKPELLYERVVEVDARGAPDGSILARPDPEQLRAVLGELRDAGISSLAVVVLHAYCCAELEASIGEHARNLGFDQVSLSAEVASEIGMVGRGDTTVVDAYLTPLIRDYVAELVAELPGSSLRIMQSSGGLTDAARFRGRNAVLSGPAGGVVAYAHVARASGWDHAIGFDMRGTSTDVSSFDGKLDREYETEIAGVRLRAPMMSIHTIAAGGGSVCRYNGFRLTVGPQSAGADPGPLCYGRQDATELTVTDVNLILGRVVDDRFPFRLHGERCHAALAAIAASTGMNAVDTAAGFVRIANASMAEAIRQVPVVKGRDLRDYALVVFGGAGGQHACAIARQLGIRTLIFHEYAGVLSAYGMGLADVTWHSEADAGRRVLDRQLSPAVASVYQALIDRGRAALRAEGFDEAHIHVIRRLDVRYRGTDTAITLDVSADIEPAATRAAFEAEHRALFGYVRIDHPVEATTLRVEVIGRDPRPPAAQPAPGGYGAEAFAPLHSVDMWCGDSFRSTDVYRREDIPVGTTLFGPVMVVDDTATIAIDPGFSMDKLDTHLIVRDLEPAVAAATDDDTRVDPVRLEIFNNLFMSIAMQMGEALRRTSVSVNIRERLDFSCAVFDSDGNLVANAPHIPVHLGAMGESIAGVLRAHPRPEPGAVYATNDPAAGGSHLPDITVITPVHDDDGELVLFTASRGHHADVGGIAPGSMPPFSATLDQEGAVLRALKIVDNGVFDAPRVIEALTDCPYPARDPRGNIADLKAQIAANQTGVRLLREVIARHGRGTVLAYMRHVQDNAADQVAAEIEALTDGRYELQDALDDGTPICVAIDVNGAHMSIDFAGTGSQLDSNLNAPRAVTIAAVIYVLRTLVGSPIPLNSGCLRPVTLNIPAGSLLDPDPDRAVAGGNVETSQRIVDVLLGALGKAAASQGTMNNLTFGTAAFGYYETIAGGAGATPNADGASGVHTHMTNTRITDPEVLESRFAVRLRRFGLRPGSGGDGLHRGGDGVVRELELLEPMTVSLLSERRTRAPFGLAGGHAGAPGRTTHNDRDIGGKATFDAAAGDVGRVETPGGGGDGRPARPGSK